MNILFVSLSSCQKYIKVEVSDRSRLQIVQYFLQLQHRHFHFYSISELISVPPCVFRTMCWRRTAGLVPELLLCLCFWRPLFICVWLEVKEALKSSLILLLFLRLFLCRSQTLISQTNLTLLLFLWKHAGRRSSFSDDIPPTQSAVFTELLKLVPSKQLLPIDETFFTTSDYFLSFCSFNRLVHPKVVCSSR